MTTHPTVTIPIESLAKYSTLLRDALQLSPIPGTNPGDPARLLQDRIREVIHALDEHVLLGDQPEPLTDADSIQEALRRR